MRDILTPRAGVVAVVKGCGDGPLGVCLGREDRTALLGVGGKGLLGDHVEVPPQPTNPLRDGRQEAVRRL